MLLDNLGDFQFAVGVVGDAVLSYVANLLLLQLEVLQRVLKVIKVHIHQLYKPTPTSHNQPCPKEIPHSSAYQQSFIKVAYNSPMKIRILTTFLAFH